MSKRILGWDPDPVTYYVEDLSNLLKHLDFLVCKIEKIIVPISYICGEDLLVNICKALRVELGMW